MAGRRKRKRKSIPKVGLLGEDVDAELAELLGQPREPLGQPVEGELPKVGLLSGEVDPALEGILDEDFRSTLRMEDDRALGAEDERAFQPPPPLPYGPAMPRPQLDMGGGRGMPYPDAGQRRRGAMNQIAMKQIMMAQLRQKAEHEKRRRMRDMQELRERVGNPRMNPAAFGERRY